MTATKAFSTAKTVGKFLQKAREAKHANIYTISGLCGLNVDTIVRLEVGDLSKFHQNPDKEFQNLTRYAQVLGVDLPLNDKFIIDTPHLKISPKKTLTQCQDDAQVFIPVFLRKRN